MPKRFPVRRWKVICIGLSTIALAATPAFEVASVKLSNPTTPVAAIEFPPGGRFTANTTLRYVIERAWDIDDYQIAGGPDWLKSERYAIDAKAASAVGEDQIRQMIQTLLVERFHLKVHRETRDLPVYALAVDKNGPKLAAAADNTACGGQGCFGISRGNMSGRGATMPRTATVLSRLLDRPVLDKTQLAGNYDFRLHYDQRSVTSPSPNLGGNTVPEEEASIFTAVEEQLGLKLEARKEAVSFLVIDSIERLSEN